MINNFLVFDSNLFEFFKPLMLLTDIGVSVYVIIVIELDPKMKDFFKAIFKELKPKITK